jgi:Skp family chaperone for outer membrane proteins
MKKHLLFIIITSICLAFSNSIGAQEVDSSKLKKVESRMEKRQRKDEKLHRKAQKNQKKLDKQERKLKREKKKLHKKQRELERAGDNGGQTTFQSGIQENFFDHTVFTAWAFKKELCCGKHQNAIKKMTV